MKLNGIDEQIQFALVVYEWQVRGHVYNIED